MGKACKKTCYITGGDPPPLCDQVMRRPHIVDLHVTIEFLTDIILPWKFMEENVIRTGKRGRPRRARLEDLIPQNAAGDIVIPQDWLLGAIQSAFWHQKYGR